MVKVNDPRRKDALPLRTDISNGFSRSVQAGGHDSRACSSACGAALGGGEVTLPCIPAHSEMLHSAAPAGQAVDSC